MQPYGAKIERFLLLQKMTSGHLYTTDSMLTAQSQEFGKVISRRLLKILLPMIEQRSDEIAKDSIEFT